MHARLQTRHQQRGRHPFARNIGDNHRHSAIRIGQEIVIVAAHGSASRVVARQVNARHIRSLGGQQPALDFGRLRQVLGQQSLGRFHLSQTCVLDADGGNVRHHGQDVEIFFGEFMHEMRRVQIDQSDHAIIGLERHRQHAADLLLHNAHALGKGLVQPGVAHQQRRFLIDHAIAHHAADAKSFAPRSAHHQVVAFDSHQNAARRTHRIDRKIHDQLEQIVQRHVAREFPARTDQRLHRGAALDFFLVAEQTFQAGGDGCGNRRAGSVRFHKDHRIGRGSSQLLGEFQRQVAGRDTIARSQRARRFNPDTVDEGAVLAVQVLHRPGIPASLQHHVLTGKARVVRVAQLIRAGTPQGVTFAIQGKCARLSVRGVDQQLARFELWRYASHEI